MSGPYEYASIVEELRRRITALIAEHPEILTFDSVWRMFDVPGFQCSDLGATMEQAGQAFALARRDARGGAE